MKEVFVSAAHPVLGPLYWVYTAAECGYPSHYSITDWSELATPFPDGWRNNEILLWMHKSHIGKVFQSDDEFSDYYHIQEEGTNYQEARLTGLLGGLHAKSGQSIEEFKQWIFNASWLDITAFKEVE